MKRLGKPKPRFKFYLNPYADMRFTRCHLSLPRFVGELV